MPKVLFKLYANMLKILVSVYGNQHIKKTVIYEMQIRSFTDGMQLYRVSQKRPPLEITLLLLNVCSCTSENWNKLNLLQICSVVT